MDYLFQEFEGYPGIHSPDFKDWLVRNQVPAIAFYSAYPEMPVRQVWKARRARQALDALLDAVSS